MNPRRVHDLMRKHFPEDCPGSAWINVADRDGVMLERIEGLLDTYIPAVKLLVEVNRKVGDFLEREDALRFIGKHIYKGSIRIVDRGFTSFVEIAVNGVARGGRIPFQSDAEKENIRRERQ